MKVILLLMSHLLPGMLFNSLSYFIFLPVTFLIFHGLNRRYKPAFLLVVSYIFYFWLHPLSPVILLLTTVTGYVFGIKISSASNEKIKGRYLFAGIFINVLILILFREVFKSVIPSVGVSFFTFQNISYLADCYLGTAEAEMSISYYALYLGFFPKLLQGPIERAGNLIPQFKGDFKCEYETLRFGAQLFAWGLFKKVVIADNLALVTNKVLGDIQGSAPLALLLLSYLYGIQLYCDFSGYTDMALGSAKFFGINLTNNFNYPYFATSIQDFWRRWHITLSSWILDYIFKPLQMKWRNYGNYGLIGSLIITFLICGLWHGISWNYILWGLYHGILISISFLTYRKWQKFCKKDNFNDTLVFVFDILVTFYMVCFGWMIFITHNLSDFLLLIRLNINTCLNFSSIKLLKKDEFGITNVELYSIYFFLFFFITGELVRKKINLKNYFYKQNFIIRCVCY